MLAAHCDTKQQKILQPILKQDLRMLGVYNVPYFYHAGPDYGRAQFKVSWEIAVGSVGHLSLTLLPTLIAPFSSVDQPCRTLKRTGEDLSLG